MRRILVDYARKRRAQKRGGSAEAVSLQEELIPDERVDLVLDLDDALEQLSAAHERQSKALEMYYFGGLTLEEVGAALDISAATAMRDVRFAKAWLAREWGETSDVE
jgi:RNA polymerase sigma factor (TIGR02999 family)